MKATRMLLAAGLDVAKFLPLLLLIVATATLMLRLHVARKKLLVPDRPEKAQASVVDVGTPELMRRHVEMFDMAREAQARLDNKIAMLQQLLVAADERIARLSELESERLHVGPYRDSELCTAEEAASADPYARDTARYAVVFGMADAGHNPMSIARRLALPLAEVELMLSLRRRLPQRPAA